MRRLAPSGMSIRHSRRVASVLAGTLALLCALAVVGGLLTGCGGSDDAAGPAASPDPEGSSRGDVLVVVADVGFEDTEYEAVHDALVAAGFTPVVADSTGDEALGSGGAKVMPDLTVAEAVAADYLAIALIGGGGTKAYWDDPVLHELMRGAVDAGIPVGAICAAPVILARAGLLEGRAATVWADYRDELEKAGCSEVGTGVVVDGALVTGDGPDAAGEFAAALVAKLEAVAGDEDAAGPGSPGATPETGESAD